MTPHICPGTETLEKSQSQRHETVTPGPAVATGKKRLMTNVSDPAHPLKDRIGHTTRPRIASQKSSTWTTEVRGQPIVPPVVQPVASVDPPSTTTTVPNVASIRSDEAQEIISKQSLCAICIDLNRLCEVAQSPPHELNSAAAQYESSSRGGCQGCAAVVRLLFGHLASGITFGRLKKGEAPYGRMRSLLNLFYMSAYNIRDRNASGTVEVSNYPSKCQYNGLSSSSKQNRLSKSMAGNHSSISNLWRHWFGPSGCMGTPRT
jgi:hypothetical protein